MQSGMSIVEIWMAWLLCASDTYPVQKNCSPSGFRQQKMAICPCCTAALVGLGQRGFPPSAALSLALPLPLCLLGGSAMAGFQPISSGILITAVAPNLGSRATEHSQDALCRRLDVSHPDGAL
eukprot:16451042-Heterocapsa_arctica.AAC.1